MNIAIPAAAGLWLPLQNLLRNVWGSAPALATTCGERPTRRPAAPHLHRAMHNVRSSASNRPLRVVRVTEAGLPRSQVGRMVISGSMADVCAELDRLAAIEALHQR